MQVGEKQHIKSGFYFLWLRAHVYLISTHCVHHITQLASPYTHSASLFLCLCSPRLLLLEELSLTSPVKSFSFNACQRPHLLRNLFSNVPRLEAHSSSKLPIILYVIIEDTSHPDVGHITASLCYPPCWILLKDKLKLFFNFESLFEQKIDSNWVSPNQKWLGALMCPEEPGEILLQRKYRKN